jgi:hypothetical protein
MNDSNVIIEDIPIDDATSNIVEPISITPEPTFIQPVIEAIPTNIAPIKTPEPIPLPINPYKTSNQHYLVRNKNIRNEMLKQSDYYMLPDVYEILSDIQKNEIRTYRQKLRDFINENQNKYLNDGIPYIPFPNPPEWVKDIKQIKY